MCKKKMDHTKLNHIWLLHPWNHILCSGIWVLLKMGYTTKTMVDLQCYPWMASYENIARLVLPESKSLISHCIETRQFTITTYTPKFHPISAQRRSFLSVAPVKIKLKPSKQHPAKGFRTNKDGESMVLITLSFNLQNPTWNQTDLHGFSMLRPQKP
jgi:hypothetical protein